MKLMLSAALFLALSGIAFAGDVNDDFGARDAFKDSGLSSSCIDKVLKSVETRCNRDSLKAEGKDRMNPCIDFQSDVATSGKYKGQIEVGGAAGDADDYWYALTIHDAASCRVSLTAEQ